MVKANEIVFNGVKYKAVGKVKQAVNPKYTEWFKKQGLSITRKDFNHKCANGKTYPAVELSNGKVAVYVRNGSCLMYANKLYAKK